MSTVKDVLSGDREAMAKLSTADLEKILAATLTGVAVRARLDPRDQEMDQGGQGRPLEAPLYRAHLSADAGSAELSTRQRFQNACVTGGGQDFVRLFRAGLRHSTPSRWSALRVPPVQL